MADGSDSVLMPCGEFNVVAFTHVAEGFMAGQRFAAGGRDAVELRFGIGIELLQFFGVVLQALAVIGFVLRIGLNQGFGNVGRVFRH